MLIDIRKTKITFIRVEELRPREVVGEARREVEIIATPLAILAGPRDAQESCMTGLFRPQEIDETGATMVEVHPL
jgi:hypothetical protein